MIFPVAGDARDIFFQVLEGQHREWRRIPVIWLQNTGIFPIFFFVSVILEMNPAWDFPRAFVTGHSIQSCFLLSLVPV